jgi:predicted kinase
MRKWMRDRLQRRKNKDPEQAGQAAPPPLQPAYFDAAEAPAAEPESDHHEAETAEAELEAQPMAEDLGSAESPERSGNREAAGGAGSSGSTAGGSSQRGRGRRRRGGRGRGGRGREQAVAQAFTPATAKGIIPDLTPGDSTAGDLTGEGSEGEATAVAEVEPGNRKPAVARTRTPAASVAVPAAPARPPKGIVVLAIGLPGSGKTSWFKRHNVVPLSSDMVRALLFDDVREQRFQDLVFSNLRSMLKARLIAKRPTNYVDATNLTPQERQHWIKLAKDYNYEVHAVFFDVPLEVCVERHQRRDRVVPEDIVRRMAAKLKAPAFDEGFAKITVVRVKKKEQEPVEQAEGA